MKIFKLLFVLFFVIIFFTFTYFTPYLFINNFIKNSDLNYNFMKYVNSQQIEYNIFLRYQKELFSDINTNEMIPEQLQKKQIMEDSIKYGIDLLIEKENLLVFFLAIKNKEDGVEYYPNYKDFNTFQLIVKMKDKEQILEFKRKNIIMWELNDIIFETDLSIFSYWINIDFSIKYWSFMLLWYHNSKYDKKMEPNKWLKTLKYFSI